MSEHHIIFDGEQVKALYTDEVPFSCLGKLKVERYSNVEYNNETGRWEAILASTGQVIATDISRESCINRERQYFYKQHRFRDISE